MLLVLWSHSWCNFRLISWWFHIYSLSWKPSLLIFLKSLCSLKSLNPANLLDNWRKSISFTKQKLLCVHKINNGFSVNVVVDKLKRSNAITSSQKKQFKQDAQLFVIIMLSILLEKSPFGSAVLQCVNIFDPSWILVLPGEKLHEKFKVFLRCFIDLGVMSPHKYDKATSDFKSF